MHRPGSVKKSGKDLWKMRIGSFMLSGIRRREWRGRRVLDTLDGVPQFLRRSERVCTDSGLKTSNTAPTTDLRCE